MESACSRPTGSGRARDWGCSIGTAHDGQTVLYVRRTERDVDDQALGPKKHGRGKTIESAKSSQQQSKQSRSNVRMKSIHWIQSCCLCFCLAPRRSMGRTRALIAFWRSLQSPLCTPGLCWSTRDGEAGPVFFLLIDHIFRAGPSRPPSTDCPDGLIEAPKGGAHDRARSSESPDCEVEPTWARR